MWKTGYTGKVVDIKISHNLNADQGLNLANVTVKRHTLHERIKRLRKMGNVLERHKQMRASGAKIEKGGGEK